MLGGEFVWSVGWKVDGGVSVSPFVSGVSLLDAIFVDAGVLMGRKVFVGVSMPGASCNGADHGCLETGPVRCTSVTS